MPCTSFGFTVQDVSREKMLFYFYNRPNCDKRKALVSVSHISHFVKQYCRPKN